MSVPRVVYSQARTATGTSLRRIGVTLAGLLALTYLVLSIGEMVRAPWMTSFWMWDTLVGEWYGEMADGEGSETLLYLDIEGYVGSRSIYITGTARWCDANGQIRDYTLTGGPDNWRGRRFHLSFATKNERDSGFSPGAMQGEWNGDQIRMLGTYLRHERTASASEQQASQPSPPPVRSTLRRGDEQAFLTACAARTR